MLKKNLTLSDRHNDKVKGQRGPKVTEIYVMSSTMFIIFFLSKTIETPFPQFFHDVLWRELCWVIQVLLKKKSAAK